MELGSELVKVSMGKLASPHLRTKVSSSDVFAIWRTSVEKAILEFSSRGVSHGHGKRRRLGFFALAPRQRLHTSDMQRLERAGLRIVNVPSSLQGADAASLSTYLSQRLEKLLVTTGEVRPPVIAARASSGSDTVARSAGVIFEDDEVDLEQLEAINDPENATDDLT
jgi:hypothetical protein